MTTVSSDATDTSAGASIYSQVTELEKQLKAQIKEKRAFHPDVRSIRSKLREKYVEIILTDPEFSEKHDIATSLWHFVYYIMIEEFRTRMRYAASSPPEKRSSVSPQKLLSEFRNFVVDATKFYAALVSKLRKKYDLPEASSDSQAPEEFKRCCSKLFIHLGDLARYKEVHSDVENYTPDWKLPASFYLRAVTLWPYYGHPHNQLAVLATYMRNDFLAVYHYFRSLAVEDPFTTARGNLTLLFERNRQQYIELSDQKRSTKDVEDKTGAEEKDVKQTFFVRFVRLNGILFTKTSLETFLDVYLETVRDLEELLLLDVQALDSLFSWSLQDATGALKGSALWSLQVIAVLIFSVPSGNTRGSYAEALQHSAITKHALTAAFKIAGCFMSTCSKSSGKSPLLPASLIFMEWLASRKELLFGSGEDEKQSQARAYFWREGLKLLNTLCELDEKSNEDTRVALPEDNELRGFSPLVSAQATLGFTKERSSDESKYSSRAQRFIAAGKAVAKAGKVIIFDEEENRFFLAGEPRAKRTKEKEKEAVQEPPKPVPPSSKMNMVNQEEDEELIVFKPPAVREPPVPSTFGVSEGIAITGNGLETNKTSLYTSFPTEPPIESWLQEVPPAKQQAGVINQLNDVQRVQNQLNDAQRVQSQLEDVSRQLNDILRVSSPLNGVSRVPAGQFIDIPRLPNQLDDGLRVPSQLNDVPRLPISQINDIQQQLNGIQRIPMGEHNVIANDVPSQLNDVSRGPVGGFTPSSYQMLGQDLLHRLHALAAVKEQQNTGFSFPLSSSQLTSGQPPVVNSQLPLVNGQLAAVNNQLPVVNGQLPLSSPLPAVSSGGDPFAARPKLSSMRPPPGFGPIPQRAVSNPKVVRPPVMDNPWSENFTSSGRSTMPPALYGSDSDIWSTTVPRSAAYPFPGMGVRTVQQVEAADVYGAWKDSNLIGMQQQQQQQPQIRPYRPQDPFVS